MPTDHDIIARCVDEPAPLLAVLHAFHDRDGTLTDQALQTVSEGLRIPVADLYGTVSFYHHLSRPPVRKETPRVCTGPVCRLRGAGHILESLSGEGAISIACPGRCDEPVPVIRGDIVEIHAAEAVHANPSRLPDPSPDGREECVFAGIREPGRSGLEGYLRTGGYDGLKQAARLGPSGILDAVTESALTGRGGAGFPTGDKWRAVREAEGHPKTIVCNADEGEPGCFQDRALLDHDPHAIIEGMAIAALATGATQGFIYLRYEYPAARAVLGRALQESEAEGFIGDTLCGTGHAFRIHIRRGGGAYICGEETSLLNSLEGKHPYPRSRPPYPVTHGFRELPTAVNNVETLAVVAGILRNGPSWYRGLGMAGHSGTKVISLSGDIARPGNYEIPVGLPLRTLLHDWAGGPLPGRSIRAVTMAGLSGGFLAGDALDVTLDEPAVRSQHSFLGAGGIMVFDDTRDMLAVAQSAMDFFAAESCGKCFPCRIGTQRMSERLSGAHGPSRLADWTEEMDDMAFTMKATSACGLGQAAPLIVESLQRHFPADVSRHVLNR